MSDASMAINVLEREFALLLAEHPELIDDEQLRTDVFEGETNIDAVLARLLEVDADADLLCDAIKARQQELSDRASRLKRRGEASRRLIERIMNAADLSKRELAGATISFRAIPPKLVEVNPALTPPLFMRVKREPNKIAIAEAIKSGEDVPGWELSNGGRGLSIRRK